MANKKPILLYQEGQQDQNHNVVQGTDVIDASHLAVLPDNGVRLNNAIEVVEHNTENFLFVKGIVKATQNETKFTRLRTVNGAISPHMTAPYTPEKDNNQYLVAPLPEPRSWAKIRVQEETVGADKQDYLVPIYHHIDLNKLEENYAQIDDGFNTVTMETLGAETTVLVQEQDAQGDTSKYVEQRYSIQLDGDDFVNVDVHLHLKNGETRVHLGPVTLKDLGTLARTAGHYAYKVILHAHDIVGVPNVGPTPPEYQKATILWATDKRLKDKVLRGLPTLFVDTRNTLVLRWGEDVDYDTTNKYVVIKF